MGRPQKNNADYFPHFSEMRNHRKVKVIRNKFGLVLGYAFWCMMLEWLTEHDGLEWEFSDLECEMFAADLGVSAAEIRQMVNFCCDIELLFKTESNFIYSESLNEELSCLFDKRKRERERSKLRQRREDGTYLPQDKVVSAAETPHIVVNTSSDSPQSRVEYSKVKESSVEMPPSNDISNSNLFRKPNIPTFEEVHRVFIQQGGSEEMAKKFFNGHESTGWFFKGSPITNYSSMIPGFISSWNNYKKNGINGSIDTKVKIKLD